MRDRIPGDDPILALAATLDTDADETIRRDVGTAPSAETEGAPPDALPTLDLTGEQTADLRVIEVLGRGGMGEVQLARQRALEREVAVKTVREDSPRLAARLLAEGRVTGQLEHPNIVPVHMLGRDAEGMPLIVMKRVDGVPWSRLSDADPELTSTRVWAPDPLLRHLEIFLEVCNAVMFAHAHGWLHRDIKPDNVMIGAFGEVVLLDWGIAARVGSRAYGDLPDGAVGMPTGTPTFMAPEMVETDGVLDERTDVFLLGASLHRMLTGKPRHGEPGADLIEVLFCARECEPYAYGDDVPAELAAICARATERDKEARYDSVRTLRQAVVAYLRHKGSLELTEEAERLLRRDDEGKTHRRRRLTECRFAFLRALREWKDNARASRGLQTCLERMVAIEIEDAQLAAAKALLEELPTPSPALTRAWEDAAEAAARESARVAGLEAQARELDPTVAERKRAVFATVQGIVALASTVAGSVLRKPGNEHHVALLMMVPITITYFGGAWWARAALLGNEANRRMMGMLGAGIAFLTLRRAVDFFAVPTVAAALSNDLMLAACAGACVAIVFDKRLMIAAALWVAGAVGVHLSPVGPLPVFGASIVLGFALMGTIWARRQTPDASL